MELFSHAHNKQGSCCILRITVLDTVRHWTLMLSKTFNLDSLLQYFYSNVIFLYVYIFVYWDLLYSTVNCVIDNTPWLRNLIIKKHSINLNVLKLWKCANDSESLIKKSNNNEKKKTFIIILNLYTTRLQAFPNYIIKIQYITSIYYYMFSFLGSRNKAK